MQCYLYTWCTGCPGCFGSATTNIACPGIVPDYFSLQSTSPVTAGVFVQPPTPLPALQSAPLPPPVPPASMLPCSEFCGPSGALTRWSESQTVLEQRLRRSGELYAALQQLASVSDVAASAGVCLPLAAAAAAVAAARIKTFSYGPAAAAAAAAVASGVLLPTSHCCIQSPLRHATASGCLPPVVYHGDDDSALRTRAAAAAFHNPMHL